MNVLKPHYINTLKKQLMTYNSTLKALHDESLKNVQSIPPIYIIVISISLFISLYTVKTCLRYLLRENKKWSLKKCGLLVQVQFISNVLQRELKFVVF